MKKGFRLVIKYAGAAVMILAICLICAGCGAAAEWKYDPITDVNDLEGRRVGVNLSWEADYYLTGRSDMELFRYDTTADMIMALKYDKIDAIALDRDSVKLIMNKSKGIEMVEPALAQLGCVMYFGADDEALMKDFNGYLAEFKKTDEYQELLKCLDEYDGGDYIGADIPLTGSGKVINVVADPNNFPRAFVNPGEDVLTGYDVEILKRFANDRGYKLEFTFSDYNDGIIGLRSGFYDVMTGYLCDVYDAEVKNVGINPSDSMYDFSLYLIQKNQRDITSDTSEFD